MDLVTSKFRGEGEMSKGVANPQGEDAYRTSIIQQYLRIAMRWRYVMLGTTVACVLLGLIVTLLTTPQYTAETTIEISRESAKVTELQGVERDAGVADQEFYETQYGLLRSRLLSERVATQLRLVDDPKFFAMFNVSDKDSALQLANGRYSVSGRSTRQRIAGEVLLKHLAVKPTQLSRLVDIRFTSPDAAFSARVTNSWAENFINTNLERKIQATSYGRNLLQGQLAQIKDRLDASQRQLVAYASAQRIINLPAQSNNDGKTTSERSIVADNLAALNTSLSQATADRIQAEARYQQVGRAGASTEALRNIAINGLREKRSELAADYDRLMTQFGPLYPSAKALQSQISQLDKSIAREESRVSGSILADYREAQQRENELQKKVEQLKSEFLDLRRRSIQYNIYQQEVDTNRALYDGLLQRFKEIGVAGGVGVNNVSVVDPADIPQKPSSPLALINLLVALFVGLGLSGLIVFALEQVDEAIVDPAEIERRFGLPLLGSVPKLENATPEETILDRKSELFDAYLAVQTNLSFTTEHGVPRSFAITSTRPAEGKTTTAVALATTLARGQRRVILVDGDMRSPSIHNLAGINHDKGLSNFLAGQDDISTLTFPMGEAGFVAMTAGPIPPNAAELLIGNRLSLLIARLLENYDHVVIDAPPVMGLADALLIGNSVEGVVFAVESNGTRSSMVKSALRRLASVNVRVLGGVLTKFDARKAHYSYGYDYGYGYGKDEQAQDKVSRSDGTA